MRLVVGLLYLFSFLAGFGQTSRRKVIIDQDAFGPGGPNLQPILMVLQDPSVEVLGITVESGDGWQKENVAHTLRMLELVGRPEIPVVGGATYPLVNSEAATARWESLYGKLGYKGAWTTQWPEGNTMTRAPYHGPDEVPPLVEGAPHLQPLAEPAASFLVRKVREFPGEVTILALGPMTNLALAARLDDSFARNAKALIAMAGSFSPRAPERDEFALQFLYAPRVEFNVRWDPEAAKITLEAGWRSIMLVPLDATTDTKITASMLQAVAASGNPVGAYLGKYSEAGFPLWDEAAAGLFLDPSLAKHGEGMRVSVDCSSGPSYGAMLSWPEGSHPGLGEPKAQIVLAVDAPRLEALFVELLRR